MARFKTTPVWWAATLLWMAGIWWLSDQPELRSGLEQDFLLRKVAHVTEFAALFLLVHQALLRQGVLRPRLLAAVWTLGYAMVDEWHQTWVFGRHGSPLDVVIDALGIALALLLLRALLVLTRRSRSSAP